MSPVLYTMEVPNIKDKHMPLMYNLADKPVAYIHKNKWNETKNEKYVCLIN